jgi:hypothetical protein
MIKMKVIWRKLRTQDETQDTTNFGGERSLTRCFVVVQFFTINLSSHLVKLKILSFLWSTWHITSMSNCEECVRVYGIAPNFLMRPQGS